MNETLRDNPRILTYAFLTLPYHVRINIVRDLGLVKGKAPLSQEDFFAKCFRKAKADKKLAELWDAVYKESKDDQKNKMGIFNPYKTAAKPAQDDEALPFQEFYDSARKVMADAYAKAMKTGEPQVATFSTNGWRELPDGKGRIKIDSIEMTITPLKK